MEGQISSMEFKVEKNVNQNKNNFQKNDIDIAYEFSKLAYKEYGTFLKAIVLFGSKAVKDDFGDSGSVKRRDEGDIDILLIVDDVSIYVTEEITETYRLILQRTIAKVSTKLHITTLKLTTFWDLIRNGDPVAINILRTGMPIIDSGFFEPVQMLLGMGRIRPSEESVRNYFSRAPTSIYNSKMSLLQATVSLYWAVIDSAHAALMRLGEMPPSPEHVSDLIQVRMVEEGMVQHKYAETMKELYNVYKGILHRNIKSISGAEYDDYLSKAEDFVRTMQKLIEANEKINRI